MRKKSIEETLAILEKMRKQPICRFDGMTIDMDYELCIPSVHAACGNQEISHFLHEKVSPYFRTGFFSALENQRFQGPQKGQKQQFTVNLL